MGLEYDIDEDLHSIITYQLSMFGSDYETLSQRHFQQARSLEVITNFLE